MKINDFINEYEKQVPLFLQEKWDNSGFQLGNSKNELNGILLSLDFGVEAVSYAIKNSLNLIFTHHPVFFKDIKTLDFTTQFGKSIELSIKNDICVYSSHTNLDYVNGGVNDTLAEIISLKDPKPILEIDNTTFGLGRFGYIERTNLLDYISKLKKIFDEETIISYGFTNKQISKIGVVGGSGSSIIKKSIDLGLDLLITSDLKYHDAEFAVDNNLNLIDLGHFVSEKFILKSIHENIKNNYDFRIEQFYYDKSVRNFL